MVPPSLRKVTVCQQCSTPAIARLWPATCTLWAMTSKQYAFLAGADIGPLAATALMIRDVSVPGANITILESSPVLGGNLDGAGDPATGYSIPGGLRYLSAALCQSAVRLSGLLGLFALTRSHWKKRCQIDHRVPWHRNSSRTLRASTL